MNSRERVLMALRRKEPDRVPRHAFLSPLLEEKLREKLGGADLEEYFRYDIRCFVGYKPTRKKADFSRYPSAKPAPGFPGKDLTEWGERWHGGAIAPNTPMRDFVSVKDVEKYPFPDVGAEYRYKGLDEEVRKIKDAGFPAISRHEPGTFEQLWGLRGLDRTLVDLVMEPEFLEPLLEKVSDLKAQIAANYAKVGVDILFTSDDLGAQDKMMMNPDTWRKHLKPCIAKIVRAARIVNPEILIAFHSDGYIEPVISDLIEAGVDILQAVQPECMDPAKLKDKYGSRISFWGTIGAQSTLAFGTPDDVRREVRKRIETVGKGGGLLIAPAHTVEEPTPPENVIAFFKAIDEFGEY